MEPDFAMNVGIGVGYDLIYMQVLIGLSVGFSPSFSILLHCTS